MKTQKQLPKLGFRNATKDQKHATCRRFINGVAALPPEKRGKMPVAELLQDLTEADAAMTRVAGLRAALKAALTMSDEKTARLCRNVTSGVQLYFSEFGHNGVAFPETGVEAKAPKKPAGPPGEPLELRAGVLPGAIKLRWKSPMRRSIFIVEFTEDPTGQTGWIRDSKNFTTRASHLLTGLKPNTAYSFRVRAQNSHGEGPWSECVTARPL
jgi:hypothetical protein